MEGCATGGARWGWALMEKWGGGDEHGVLDRGRCATEQELV